MEMKFVLEPLEVHGQCLKGHHVSSQHYIDAGYLLFQVGGEVADVQEKLMLLQFVFRG